jgi:hypothetical protein
MHLTLSQVTCMCAYGKWQGGQVQFSQSILRINPSMAVFAVNCDENSCNYRLVQARHKIALASPDKPVLNRLHQTF